MFWHIWVLALAAVSLLSLHAQAEGPAVKKAATPGEIEQLVKQLGSSDFAERQAASKQLEAIGSPALAALRRAVSENDDLETQSRAARLAARIENRLEGLLADYLTHGLPLPPAQAKLVRTRKGKDARTDDEPGRIVYSLAFQSEAELPADAEEVDPDGETLADVALEEGEALSLAIPCHARGWDRLAGYLLQRSRQETETSPHRQLLQIAWQHWERHLSAPKIDRAPVARHLKELLAQDRELDTEENRALLRSLELALVPSKAKPGSVEALIDDLVDYSSRRGIGMELDAESRERWERILRLGFAAVPALIEHLGDDRLTRALVVVVSDGEIAIHHMRVGDVAACLLKLLAGEDSGNGSILARRRPLRKTEVLQWWEEARKQGEEAYLLAHVLPADDREIGASVCEPLLQVIAAKYPRQLPALYRTLLEKHPRLASEAVAAAVLHCEMPAREKAALFAHAAGHKENRHRLPALRALRQIDRKQLNALLLPVVESLPTDVPGVYRDCLEVRIAELVSDADDPRVWAALEKAARRARVGLRMEMLHQLCRQENSGHRRERLALLARFLDDATVRDTYTSKTAGKFKGACAASAYPRIEVRNFAALEMAQMLGIKVPVETGRTPVIWAWVRDKVRTACTRELDQK